ncbi:uncharacterized protein ARMOST_13613 [Armillaria ostoyae]|uniref:Uncharacterized protein n=1 Tax=Armillaria ostoyae TaxID=47428 RepID=A0A284RN86_ARMOS|nr:uncharacterized protein ARMOST_13613 [Armillaria ostoyae]
MTEERISVEEATGPHTPENILLTELEFEMGTESRLETSHDPSARRHGTDSLGYFQEDRLPGLTFVQDSCPNHSSPSASADRCTNPPSCPVSSSGPLWPMAIPFPSQCKRLCSVTLALTYCCMGGTNIHDLQHRHTII